jgi:GNAT superfamily N-acetyltransferase
MTIQSIRPAVIGDADGVAALVARAYSKWIPVIGRPPKPMLADYRRAIAEHIVYVIEDAQSAGLAAIVELVAAPDHMLVENVAVDPARQGQGLGRMLLAHAEVVARERQLPVMRLYTNALMRSNIDLYERLGYVTIERRYIEKLDTTVVYMSKTLDQLV